jgi:pimeloyl-ACP methyl ester carboxylesterase
MLRRSFVTSVTAAGISLTVQTLGIAQTDSSPSSKGASMKDPGGQTGYAPVNGLRMYYEIHGTGEPLVLLHGGFGTIETDFGQILPLLDETRQLIAVELQAHGHTADIDRPLRFEQMADDIAALIEHLELEHADIFGFSLGGGVALQTAIRHPELVRKLVVASAPYRQDGWYPEVLAGMASMNATGAADAMLGTPMHEAYVSRAPQPEDWPILVAKLGQLLREDYDWADDVTAIEAPTLVIVGDADSVRPTHAVELFQLLGGGVPGDFAGLPNAQLAVLPGTTHFGVLARSDLLLPILTAFLDAPMREGR